VEPRPRGLPVAAEGSKNGQAIGKALFSLGGGEGLA